MLRCAPSKRSSTTKNERGGDRAATAAPVPHRSRHPTEELTPCRSGVIDLSMRTLLGAWMLWLLGCGGPTPSPEQPVASQPATMAVDESPPEAVVPGEVPDDCPFPEDGAIRGAPTACPAWRDASSSHAILLVRATDLALTDSIGGVHRLPRSATGWEQAVDLLAEEKEMGSVVLIATSEAGADGEIECARRAGGRAGLGHPAALWPIYSCRITDGFRVMPDGSVIPPSPDEAAAESQWRSAADVVGSCIMNEYHRCQEYLATNREIQRGGLNDVRTSCAEADDGVWTQGTCPTSNLVGICDRSETHGLVRYFYESELTAASSARASCDEGVFRESPPR